MALSDFGLPRNTLNGTIAFSCLGESGFASGSDLAAATIALFSAIVGMTIAGRLDIDIFDIMIYLSTYGAAQTDDFQYFTVIYICNLVKGPGLRR